MPLGPPSPSVATTWRTVNPLLTPSLTDSVKWPCVKEGGKSFTSSIKMTILIVSCSGGMPQSRAAMVRFTISPVPPSRSRGGR